MTIALFPGRFQPPHLGHMVALMRIYPLYDKIIVGVTEYTYGGAKKQVIYPRQSKEILQQVLKHLPKFEVVLIGKGLLERNRFDDLPKFDVVVTSNLTLLHRLEKLGIKTRPIKRAKALLGWSGKSLREAFWS